MPTVATLEALNQSIDLICYQRF